MKSEQTTCPICGGRGITPPDGGTTVVDSCPHCHGTGLVPAKQSEPDYNAAMAKALELSEPEGTYAVSAGPTGNMALDKLPHETPSNTDKEGETAEYATRYLRKMANKLEKTISDHEAAHHCYPWTCEQLSAARRSLAEVVTQIKLAYASYDPTPDSTRIDEVMRLLGQPLFTSRSSDSKDGLTGNLYSIATLPNTARELVEAIQNQSDLPPTEALEMADYLDKRYNMSPYVQTATPPTDTGAETLQNLRVTPEAVAALIGRISADETMSKLIVRLAQTEAQGVAGEGHICDYDFAGYCLTCGVHKSGTRRIVAGERQHNSVHPRNCNCTIDQLIDGLLLQVEHGGVVGVQTSREVIQQHILADKEKAVREARLEEAERALMKDVSFPSINYLDGGAQVRRNALRARISELKSPHQLEEDGK